MSNLIQDSIHDWEAEQGITDATMLASQLEVIAYELRTANLLGLHSAYDTRREPRKAHEVLTQIEERLAK